MKAMKLENVEKLDKIREIVDEHLYGTEPCDLGLAEIEEILDN